MHNNYYFLRQLTKKLGEALSGTVISECFSQNKDELVIRLEGSSSPFFIKASLQSHFSCLSFPRDFHRARKNSIDLFAPIIGQKVSHFHQFENERSFAMHLTPDSILLFKMHGNRSNLIHFHQNRSTEIFKSKILEDAILDLKRLDRQIDWSEENFLANQTSVETLYFTFGKPVWKYLEANGFAGLSHHDRWKAILSIRDRLENPDFFYIQEADGRISLSLLEFGRTIQKFKDPVVAITEFFNYYTAQEAFTKEKSSALSVLKTKLHASESYLEKTKNKLHSLEQDNNYKIWADLIMANLHDIIPGSEKVTLPNFYYDNHLTEIKLKRDLTPQKNAANFYRKAKNQLIEISRLQELIDAKTRASESIADLIQSIEAEQDLKSLKKLMQRMDLFHQEKQHVTSLPYREVEFKQYKIWIGKNAQSNDVLTLKYGYKEDLFLHAKDVAGSHVLIKYQSGKTFPKDVIERAAQLAAYYSKRKNDSLCPVTVTPRKFVRKRKGDPAGMVVVEREEVVMVEPVGM